MKMRALYTIDLRLNDSLLSHSKVFKQQAKVLIATFTLN
jgi:hypothetical protein